MNSIELTPEEIQLIISKREQIANELAEKKAKEDSEYAEKLKRYIGNCEFSTKRWSKANELTQKAYAELSKLPSNGLTFEIVTKFQTFSSQFEGIREEDVIADFGLDALYVGSSTVYVYKVDGKIKYNATMLGNRQYLAKSFIEKVSSMLRERARIANEKKLSKEMVEKLILEYKEKYNMGDDFTFTSYEAYHKDFESTSREMTIKFPNGDNIVLMVDYKGNTYVKSTYKKEKLTVDQTILSFL